MSSLKNKYNQNMDCFLYKGIMLNYTELLIIAKISSEEVNVSNPTPEELQTINPYALLSIYKSGYNYKYTGIKSRNGKQGFEVILTPENKQDITSITLFVSQTYQPLYIKVEQSNKSANEIIVTSYQTNQPLDNATFKFDKKKFPNAEVIDLR